MEINGVLGKISTDDLGCTLIHEHVVCCDWSMRMAFREKWFEYDKVVEIAVGQLKKAKEQFGITTVVDGTATNLGRDIHLIRDVAEKSGVNMIASTGMYFNEEPFMMGKPINLVLDLMLQECAEGIEDTKILPGIIKSATDSYGITKLNRELIYMASEIHNHTDLPIFAHSCAPLKTGLLQQDEFERNGVVGGALGAMVLFLLTSILTVVGLNDGARIAIEGFVLLLIVLSNSREGKLRA